MKATKIQALLILTGVSALVAAFQASTSPNKFYKPECTWCADWNAYENGWKLTFSATSGRHGYAWWDMVTNAGGRGSAPQPNSIMVFSKTKLAPYGHVAWVKSVNGSQIVVNHSNFNGTARHEDVFELSNGSARLRGGKTWYAVTGFLYKPNTQPPPPAPEKLYVADEDAAASAGQPGFFRHGPAQYWKRMTDAGRDGGMYYTLNNSPELGITNMADWRPTVRDARNYEVFVFIPRRNATTTAARYEIYAANGRHDRGINQNYFFDAWVSLGVFPFNQGHDGLIRLIDVTSEKKYTKRIGFDAIKLEPR